MDQQTDETIVVGVDGSPQSVAALRWAARLAPAYGATVKVVGAWENPPEYVNFVHFKDDHFDELARKRVDRAVHEAFGESVPAGLSTVVEFGHPSKVLMRHSEGATMLVVGRRGHGGFKGLLMGSTSSAVVAHAPCPVLVLPDREADPEGAEESGQPG
ncbi:universal stress protein [uncultured Kocuria sp.]|uniref:universal stress protein n=1 Tax=uncultured Kocuria sp. TaxID=259305 RepID=UPI002614C7DA|nr:universal stress protein [uncultured Kocuria sp.]